MSPGVCFVSHTRFCVRPSRVAIRASAPSTHGLSCGLRRPFYLFLFFLNLGSRAVLYSFLSRLGGGWGTGAADGGGGQSAGDF